MTTREKNDLIDSLRVSLLIFSTVFVGVGAGSLIGDPETGVTLFIVGAVGWAALITWAVIGNRGER